VYRSDYFSDEEGVDVFYSYNTCNSTADDWLAVNGDVAGKESALNGISITASVPKYQVPIMYKRDPSSGEPFSEVGKEYYNNTIGYEGIFPEFIRKVVEISNGDIADFSYTFKSRAASVLHPTSSYTATVQDVEDGLIDMGVAPFWVTSQRLKMAAFTIPILYDKTYLVVPMSSETVGDQVSKVLAPFHYGVWISIVLIIILTALLSVWFSDPFEKLKRRNRMQRAGGAPVPKYRNSKAYARLAVDEVLEKGIFFCSAGIEQDKGASLPSKVLLFGFAGFVLIVVSAYVANLAAFLTLSTSSGVTTVEGAMKESVLICAHPAVETELKVAWPNAKFYFHQNGNEVMGMIEDYEAGKCQILAIGWEDNTMDVGIREKLCENDLRFTDSVVIETPQAFPINPKLASGFSYWMYEAEKNHGISITKMNEEYLAQVNEVSRCPLKLSDQSAESSDTDQITLQNLALPMILYAASVGLAVLLQIVRHRSELKGRDSSLLGTKSQLHLGADRPTFKLDLSTDTNKRRFPDEDKKVGFKDNSDDDLPQGRGLEEGRCSGNDEIEEDGSLEISEVSGLYADGSKEL
jgi:hypothetical protein